MGSLIGLLIERGVPERFARPLLIAALFLLVLVVLAGVWAAVKHDVIADHEAKIEQRARPATDTAASERAADTIATTRHEQELHDVIAAQPDQPIAPSSRALACKRLHDAGRDPPACR